MTPTHFEKSIDVSDGGLRLRIEAAKAECMVEALTGHPEFSTPRLLDVDEEKGLLVFERLAELQPLHPRMPVSRFEEVGVLLAIIHRALTLPKELTFVREADTEVADTDVASIVFVHGDFQPKNLAIVNERLVVFDWGIRPWGDELYTRASPAVDLASFLTPWQKPYWWDFGFPAKALGAFVAKYNNETHHPVQGVAQREELEQAIEPHRTKYRRAIANLPLPVRVLHSLKYQSNTRRLSHELDARISS